MQLDGTAIDKLVSWLGPDGAIAGLDSGKLTAAELLKLAEAKALVIDKKSSRHDIICELVNAGTRVVTESPDELTQMSRRELERLLIDRNVSVAEMSRILSEFEMEPRRMTRSKMIEFFANEVADIGMYQRVSRGRTT